MRAKRPGGIERRADPREEISREGTHELIRPAFAMVTKPFRGYDRGSRGNDREGKREVVILSSSETASDLEPPYGIEP